MFENKELGRASEIIELFGGIRPMAKKLGVPVTTVQGWKKRDVIPENRVELVINGAKRNGIPMSRLEGFLANPVTNGWASVSSTNTVKEDAEGGVTRTASSAKTHVQGATQNATTLSTAAASAMTTSSKDVAAGTGAAASGVTGDKQSQATMSSKARASSAGSSKPVNQTQTESVKQQVSSKRDAAESAQSNGKKMANQTKQTTTKKKSSWLSVPSLLAAALTALLVSLIFWLLAGSNTAAPKMADADTQIKTQSFADLSQVDGLSSKVGDLEAKVSGVDGRLTDFISKSKTAAVAATAAAAGGLAASASADSGVDEGRVAALEEKLNSISTDNESLKTAVSKLASENAALSAKLEAAANQPVVAPQVAADGTVDSSTSTGLDNLKMELGGRIDSVEAQVAKLGSSPAANNQTVEMPVVDPAQFTPQIESAVAANLEGVKAEMGERFNGLEGQIASVQTGLSDLQTNVDTRFEAAESSSTDSMAEIAAITASVGALTSKASTIEEQQTAFVAEQKAVTERAAKAEADKQMAGNRMLGVSRLRDALANDQPFSDELTFLNRNVGDDEVLATITGGLAPYADGSAVSLEALTSEFQGLSTQVRRKARATGAVEGDRVEKIQSGFANLFNLRKIDGEATSENQPEADTSVVSQMGAIEGLIKNQDLTGAVSKISELEGPAQEALSGWVEKAQSRQIVDQAKTTLDSWLGQFSAQ